MDCVANSVKITIETFTGPQFFPPIGLLLKHYDEHVEHFHRLHNPPERLLPPAPEDTPSPEEVAEFKRKMQAILDKAGARKAGAVLIFKKDGSIVAPEDPRASERKMPEEYE